MSDTAVKQEENKENKDPSGALFSMGFIIVLLYLAFNICFSWFSPGWAEALTPHLIEEEEKPEESANQLPDIKALPVHTYSKVGNIIRVLSSIRDVSSRQLKNICDRRPETKMEVTGETRKGDNVLLEYSKSFPCKGISLRMDGPEELKAQLQISNDGIIFSSVKLLVPGANDVKLKNENIRAVRILVTEPVKAKWSLGDVSCR